MARTICKICGWNVTEQTGDYVGRTAHLKNVHGLAPYDGVVKDYFLHPWEGEVCELCIKSASENGFMVNCYGCSAQPKTLNNFPKPLETTHNGEEEQ